MATSSRVLSSSLETKPRLVGDSSDVFELESLYDQPVEVSGERRIPNAPKESDEVEEIRERIARKPENPQAAWQERQDKLQIATYEQRLCRMEELSIMLKIRLGLAKVDFHAYDEQIAHPERPLRREQVLPGQLSFKAMAEEYNSLKALQKEKKPLYEAACKQFDLSVEEASARGKKATKQESRTSSFTEKQHQLSAVYENVLAKANTLLLEDAIALHELVVEALRDLASSKHETTLAYEDRRALLVTRHLHEQIETRLDLVRVQEMREVDALAAEIQALSGGSEQGAVKKTELRNKLVRLAPLYRIDVLSEGESIISARESYHLIHARLRELSAWLEEGRIPKTDDVLQRKDELFALNASLERKAYRQHGRCLSKLPIEMYAASGAR